MNILKTIVNFLKKTGSSDQNEAPEGFCPNCWGREEYGGKFYEAVKNHNTDINNKNPNIGWIQEYAEKHLSSIMLKKKGEEDFCQNCKLTYRPSS